MSTRLSFIFAFLLAAVPLRAAAPERIQWSTFQQASPGSLRSTDILTGIIGGTNKNATVATVGQFMRDNLTLPTVQVQVVVDGDSISSTNFAGVGRSWPDYLAREFPWNDFSTTNFAIPFRAFTNCYFFMTNRLVSDLYTATTKVVFVWAGVNDLGLNGTTTNVLINAISNYYINAKALGYKVGAFTIAGSSYDYYESNSPPPTFTTNRYAVNNWIRARPYLYDFLVDADTILTNSVYQFDAEFCSCNFFTPLNPIYEVGDGIHINSIGSAVIAKYIAQNFFIISHPASLPGGTVGLTNGSRIVSSDIIRTNYHVVLTEYCTSNRLYSVGISNVVSGSRFTIVSENTNDWNRVDYKILLPSQ